MEGFIGFIVGLAVIVTIFFIVNFIATRDTKWNDFYNEGYFESKHGSTIKAYKTDGLSDNEAYEKIIVKQDETLLERYRWIMFWATLSIVAFVGGASI